MLAAQRQHRDRKWILFPTLGVFMVLRESAIPFEAAAQVAGLGQRLRKRVDISGGMRANIIGAVIDESGNVFPFAPLNQHLRQIALHVEGKMPNFLLMGILLPAAPAGLRGVEHRQMSYGIAMRKRQCQRRHPPNIVTANGILFIT